MSASATLISALFNVINASTDTGGGEFEFTYNSEDADHERVVQELGDPTSPPEDGDVVTFGFTVSPTGFTVKKETGGKRRKTRRSKKRRITRRR